MQCISRGFPPVRARMQDACLFHRGSPESIFSACASRLRIQLDRLFLAQAVQDPHVHEIVERLVVRRDFVKDPRGRSYDAERAVLLKKRSEFRHVGRHLGKQHLEVFCHDYQGLSALFHVGERRDCPILCVAAAGLDSRPFHDSGQQVAEGRCRVLFFGQPRHLQFRAFFEGGLQPQYRVGLAYAARPHQKNVGGGAPRCGVPDRLGHVFDQPLPAHRRCHQIFLRNHAGREPVERPAHSPHLSLHKSRRMRVWNLHTFLLFST